MLFGEADGVTFAFEVGVGVGAVAVGGGVGLLEGCGVVDEGDDVGAEAGEGLEDGAGARTIGEGLATSTVTGLDVTEAPVSSVTLTSKLQLPSLVDAVAVKL